jgi:hypothetical protein
MAAAITLAKMKAGPFPSDWFLQIQKLYQAGGCDVECRALIAGWRGGTFNQDTWERWLVDEEEFFALISFCRQLSEAWWLKEGRINIGRKDFNAKLYALQMNNRWGWSSSKHDVTEGLTKLLGLLNGSTRELPVKPSAGATGADAGGPGVAA